MLWLRKLALSHPYYASRDRDWETVAMNKKKIKQLGLLEPWFVVTHTIWTTQEDTVFISDRTGMMVNVQWWDQTFRGTPSLSVKARKNVISSKNVKTFFLAFTDDEGVPRNVWSHHWTSTTVPVLSLIKSVSSCIVQIVCVITNQGSSNPNCLNFLKDAYKVYQGIPPTYQKIKNIIFF